MTELGTTVPEKNLKEIASLVSDFQLRDIRMVGCECGEPRLEPTGLPEYLNLQTKVSSAIDRKSHVLRVEITLNLFAGYSESDDASAAENAAIRMSSKYRMHLNFSKETTQPDKDIATFGQRSGIIFVWPMWREFVLSMCGRLGLPPVIVPLLNIAGIMANANEKKGRYSQVTAKGKKPPIAPRKKTRSKA